MFLKGQNVPPKSEPINSLMIGLFFRMTEVDESMNYMLGQLSLVVSEFNQV